tara:strand:- start:43 stop:381 length:339 start_codon:yes stop_codon:yes gene_type:complete
MVTGKNCIKQETINNIKVGHYIRWKPPLSMRVKSDYHQYGFDSFIGSGSNWEYGLVIDLLESPRERNNPDTTVGLHLQILKDGQVDWVFNFEYLEEIEIVGFLDEEYEKHNP